MNLLAFSLLQCYSSGEFKAPQGLRDQESRHRKPAPEQAFR